jgi:hypothetical protein
MSKETGITRQRIMSELSRSPHGRLEEYLDIGCVAAMQEPDFLAHLIAWDKVNGQVRDSKVALPIVALTNRGMDEEFVDNALAHFGSLGPRELVRAYRFALGRPVAHRKLRKVVQGWLREKEANAPKWDRVALQHHKSLKELYALTHTAPNTRADAVLFKRLYPAGSVFQMVRGLSAMAPAEAAGTILQYNLPFLIVRGALGKKSAEPDLVMALIDRMSANELITNTKMLEGLGIKTNPVLRAAFDSKLKKATEKPATGAAMSILKTAKAAEAVKDEGLRSKLMGAQEKQLDAHKGIEGNWLVLGDKSGSMQAAIEAAKEVAGLLARMVKGKVYLVFFDASPQLLEVTGMELGMIKRATRHFAAQGATSIGCGLQRLLDEKLDVDGIAIVSDAEENTAPWFADAYTQACEEWGKRVPVYLYRCGKGQPYYANRDLVETMRERGHDLQEFSLGASVDFYSLPNLVSTMRTNRYSLIDEVMAVPLLRLEDVFKVVDFKEKNVKGVMTSAG